MHHNPYNILIAKCSDEQKDPIGSFCFSQLRCCLLCTKYNIQVLCFAKRKTLVYNFNMFKNNSYDGSRKRSRGFVQFIILIIIALALLKYFFGISVKDIFNNEVVQDILSIAKSLFKVLWDTLLLALDFIKELLATAKTFVGGLNK